MKGQEKNKGQKKAPRNVFFLNRKKRSQKNSKVLRKTKSPKTVLEKGRNGRLEFALNKIIIYSIKS